MRPNIIVSNPLKIQLKTELHPPTDPGQSTSTEISPRSPAIVLSTSLGKHTNWHNCGTSPTKKSLIDDATPLKKVPQKLRRTKSSSTNNPYLNATITAPDNQEIVKCVALTIHCAVSKAVGVESDVGDHIWSEEYRSLDANVDAWTTTPSQKTVENFLLHIFSHTVMSSECCVMALAYMDRLLEYTAVLLQPKNWRRLLLGALIVASKVWEDDAVWNEDFLHPFPSMKIADLGELERYYLNGLQFSVTLKPSVYAEYYFRLIRLSDKNETNFQPLDEESVEKLYLRSKGLEESQHQNRPKAIRRKSAQRTYSLEITNGRKAPTVSTEQISFPKKDVPSLVGQLSELEML